MIVELLVIGIVLYTLFGDYITAKAEMIQEEARALRLKNDAIEDGE